MVNYPPGAILYKVYHVHSGLVFLKKMMQTNNTYLHQYSLIQMSMQFGTCSTFKTNWSAAFSESSPCQVHWM